MYCLPYVYILGEIYIAGFGGGDTSANDNTLPAMAELKKNSRVGVLHECI